MKVHLMNIVVVLGHPDTGSFNHAIARMAVETLQRSGHVVIFHDLYAEGFDPILPGAEIPEGAPLEPAIAQRCAEIAAADGIVMDQAEVPSGVHLLRLDVKDMQGREATAVITLKVSEK